MRQLQVRFFSPLYPWLMWLMSTSFVFYQSMMQSSVSAMIPELQRSFSLNTVQIGLLSSSFFYSYLLLQIPAGILVDRFSASAILIGGIVPCALCVWLFAHAHSFLMAEILRIGIGAFAAPAIAATLSICSEWFSSRQFALAVGLTEMSGMVGSAVGIYFLANGVNRYGWHHTLMLAALFGLILAVIMALFLRDRPLTSNDSLAFTHKERIFHHFSSLAKNSQLWLNGFYISLTFALVSAFAGLWCIPYLQARYTSSLEMAAIGSAVIYIGMAIGCPLTGLLSNYLSRKSLMFYQTMAYLTLLVVVFYWPALPLSINLIALFLLGMSVGVYILAFAMARDTVPSNRRGAAMAAINMSSMVLGSLILQPAIGAFLRTQAGVNGVGLFSVQEFNRIFIIFPILIFLALLLIPFIKEHSLEIDAHV